MKNITLITFLFILSNNQYIFAQPTIIDNFIEGPMAIHFVNQNTGLVVGGNNSGNGEIRKTTDGGKSWVNLLSFNTYYLGDLCFINQNNYIAVGNFGTILKTTNDGISWNSIYYPTDVSLPGVNFIDSENGYIVGEGFFSPIFLKTTNSGYNWINIPLDTNLGLYGLDFLNKNFGFAVGNRIILKTTNAGETYTRYINNNYYLYSVEVLDSNVAFIGGLLNPGGALILKTENAGTSWSINYSNNLNGNLNKIRFLNPDFGVAVGNGGLVVRTTNGGAFWEEQILINSSELHDVYFINSNTGWIVGRAYPNGLLFKTINAGVNWFIQNIFTDSPSEFSLLQNYPNPFNPKTKINYKLGNLSKVVLKVFDITGKEIQKLVDGTQEVGVYEVDFDGNYLSSGVYFYTINAGDFQQTKRMILLK